MERLGALVAALSLAACADIMGFEEGQPPPEAEAASAGASTVASSSQSGVTSGGQGGAGGEPNGDAGAGGAALPTRIAFVSATAIGSQSGMAALDAFCMTEAAAHFPNKQFVAWLSQSGGAGPHVDAKDRIIDAEWYRPDGLLIAASKSDLLDGTLENPINVKANGNPVGMVAVWTGTLASGNDSTHDCNGWGGIDPASSSATLGASDQKDGDWTHYLVGECNESHHVYCFEE